MDTNPYTPSAEENLQPQQGRDASGNQYAYYPINGLAKWIGYLILPLCLSYIAISIFDTVGYCMFEGYLDPNAPISGDAETALIFSTAGVGLLALPLLLAVGILVCKFMYRGNSNVRSFGAQGVDITPGWCCGYWFVPFANLLKPFHAMKEISQASRSPLADDWKNNAVGTKLGWWWFFWIFGGILARIEARLPADLGVGALVLAWTSTAFLCLAGLLLVKIVKGIRDDQDAFLSNGTPASSSIDTFSP